MDQKKIGALIAERRREKHLTQQQLAEMLDVTNKSVSKWENGICLPDPSLYQPLCDCLGLTIGELFGEERNVQNETGAYLLRLLEERLYDKNAGITFVQFHRALEVMAETTLLLSRFPSCEEAVAYLVQETGLSLEECAQAYDLYKQGL